MKKFIFFHLWRIDELEKYLEVMEQNGYRLEKIKHSYFFYFKEAKPKQMNYFLSYKSFRGKSMGSIEYALLSNHSATPIESKKCFYTMYRTKECKSDLWLLYGGRMDYIRGKLFEKALTAFLVSIIFSLNIFLALIFQSSYRGLCFITTITLICLIFTVYYSFGYFKQKNKCKKYEQSQKR